MMVINTEGGGDQAASVEHKYEHKWSRDAEHDGKYLSSRNLQPHDWAAD